MNTCKLVRSRKKRQEKEKQGKADNGKDLETENATGIESDMGMAMTLTIKSAMSRGMESMTARIFRKETSIKQANN